MTHWSSKLTLQGLRGGTLPVAGLQGGTLHVWEREVDLEKMNLVSKHEARFWMVPACIRAEMMLAVGWWKLT